MLNREIRASGQAARGTVAHFAKVLYFQPLKKAADRLMRRRPGRIRVDLMAATPAGSAVRW